MSESLILKYRPRNFKEVIGQKSIVGSFKNALDDRASHAFMFVGPAGCGKTTLSRLGAQYVGTEKQSLREISAAVYNGVDDMRELEKSLAYKPLKGSVKSVVLDECQRVTIQGWDALLKVIEEPPSWLYWFFCTTNRNRVPKTILTRCTIYELRQVPFTELYEYLCKIVEIEKFKTPNQIIELCVRHSDGSPRKALSNLSACYAAYDRAEALTLIAHNEISESGAAYRIARALASGMKWKNIQPLLVELSEEPDFDPESARHTILSYFSKIILGKADECPDEKTVCAALQILENFLEPFNRDDGLSPVLSAVGRSLFARV